MLGELNKTGTSVLKTVRYVADVGAVLAKWGKSEAKDSAFVAKQSNEATQDMRVDIAIRKTQVQLQKENFEIAKGERKNEVKLKASGLNIVAGENNAK